jgi:hypothetical protein
MIPDVVTALTNNQIPEDPNKNVLVAVAKMYS